MPTKITIEVPDELLEQFPRLSGYVPGVKDHSQTRRYLLSLAERGLDARLDNEEAFYAGRPSIIINGKILSKEQAVAMCAAATRYGDALKDGDMGPIDDVRVMLRPR